MSPPPDVHAIIAGDDETLRQVSIQDAAEVAEALAEAEAKEPLSILGARVIPRLVKKERFEALEQVWLACCASSALPLEAMSHAIERLAAKGHSEAAEEHLSLLVDTLVDEKDYTTLAEVAASGLGSVSSFEVLQKVAKCLPAAFPEAPNAQEVCQLLCSDTLEPTEKTLRNAVRALTYCPGSFVYWHGQGLARIVSVSVAEDVATVAHPSGSEEKRPLDLVPPPKLLTANHHDVLRFFDPERLKSSWQNDPIRALMSLLEAQGGSVTTKGLEAIVVPDILTPEAFEKVYGELKKSCAEGDPALPSYDSRRRHFLAPGAIAKPVKKKAAKRKTAKPAPLAPKPENRPQSSSAPLTATKVQWVDLTRFPEIRALISGVEEEVAKLTKELATELPGKLEEARAHGDLRENAEYEAAKDRQCFVEARIEQLREWLGKLHELARLRLVSGQVTLMSQVRVLDESGGEKRDFRIVPAELPDPQPGDISAGTPYAKSFLGKEEGDTVVVRLPKRTERLEIVAVKDPQAPE